MTPEIDPTLPEPVRRFLQAGARLEAIVLDAEGHWHHEGQPFTNQNLSRLFHRSIGRTAGGTWVLSIPPFTYPIQVVDTAYHVRSVHITGTGPGEQALLLLSDGTEEPLSLMDGALRHVPGRGLYCRVKGGTFEARFNRPAYYALADRIEQRGESFVLLLGDREAKVETG